MTTINDHHEKISELLAEASNILEALVAYLNDDEGGNHDIAQASARLIELRDALRSGAGFPEGHPNNYVSSWGKDWLHLLSIFADMAPIFYEIEDGKVARMYLAIWKTVTWGF